jgi:hypothetical protein
MHGGGTAGWKTVLFESARLEPSVPGKSAPAPSGLSRLTELSRPERLALLYRFQNGEAPLELRLVDPVREAVITAPAEIDWSHFPVLEALEAVTRDELHRLRTLLRADTTPTPTPTSGLLWGVDLRQGSLPGGPISEA